MQCTCGEPKYGHLCETPGCAEGVCHAPDPKRNMRLLVLCGSQPRTAHVCFECGAEVPWKGPVWPE